MQAIKVLFGTLFVLGSIVYANFVFVPQDDAQPKQDDQSGLQLVSEQPRCPEDAVRLLIHWPHDKGVCAPADDFAEGELRDAALDVSATCQPVGTGVVSVEKDGAEVLGWCNQGGQT